MGRSRSARTTGICSTPTANRSFGWETPGGWVSPRGSSWPDEFSGFLAADRVKKGFNVVQIVAGLYPDMFPFDPRGSNEAGFPWEAEYARINPKYFDEADTRIRYLIDQGITPCIVGAWGYFLPWMGDEKMKSHWRYLIARYGSWPVVWCRGKVRRTCLGIWPRVFRTTTVEQTHGWIGDPSNTSVRPIRFYRLLTIHPTAINQYTARHATDDESLLDFDMLQTPHGQLGAAYTTIGAMRHSYSASPTMPVIDGEAAYEMLSDSLPTEWTRAMFWICMMSGAAGHTYGANGIWQNNRPGDPHGRSPNGPGYGKITSHDAMNLPGSHQIGLGKKFLEQFPWQKFQPHPEWARYDVEPLASLDASHWVWFPEGDPAVDAPVAKRAFRVSFDLPAGKAIASGELRFSADDAATVWVNGEVVGSCKDWSVGTEVNDVGRHLHGGKNIIAVLAENKAANVAQNPAGLIAALQVRFVDGSTQELTSGSSWRASQQQPTGWESADFDDSSWVAAKDLGKYGMQPWGILGGRDNKLDQPQSAGIPGKVRVIYMLHRQPIVVQHLEPGRAYKPTIFDPVTGQSLKIKSSFPPFGLASVAAGSTG